MRRNALHKVFKPFVYGIRAIVPVVIHHQGIDLFDGFGGVRCYFFHPFSFPFRFLGQFVAFGFEMVNQGTNASGKPLDQQHGPAQRAHGRLDGGAK